MSAHDNQHCTGGKCRGESPHPARCDFGGCGGYRGQGCGHIQRIRRRWGLWTLRCDGRVPGSVSDSQPAHQSDRGVDESGIGADPDPGKNTRGLRARSTTAVEFHAVDVRIADRCFAGDGGVGAGVLSADRFGIFGAETRSFGAAVLRPPAGGVAQWHRYQLHRRS